MCPFIKSRRGTEHKTAGGIAIMNKQTKCKKSERGVALIFALLAILVLSVLAVAILGTSMAQNWTSYNYRLTAQARYAAETGVQQTMNWLANTYTPPTVLTSYLMTANPVTYLGNPVVLSATSGVTANYPDATVSSAYATAMSASLPTISGATYTTSAKLLRMTQSSSVSWLPGSGGLAQTWQITSVGSIAGVRNATVQVVETFEKAGSPVFSYSLDATGTGCGAVTFKGGDFTDSYNSSLGSYASQVSSITHHALGTGNVVTAGNVNLASSATVNGTITAANTTVGACPGAGVTDPSTTNHGAIVAPPAGGNPPTPLPWGCTTQPCYPSSPAALTTSQNISSGCTGITGCTVGGYGMNGTSSGKVTSETVTDAGSSRTANVYTLAPGGYGNITIGGADVVHLSAGTYAINSINFSQDGQLVVDSGPVVLNMAGNCASGCPSETISSQAINGTTANTSMKEVIYGSGQAGFNGCANGVTANPDVYGSTTCGSAKSAYNGVASNMQIVYGGTLMLRLGGMPNAAVVYAPAATYYTPGAPVGLFGSIVCKIFDDQSGSPFVYDTALGTTALKLTSYKPIGGFSWSKF
jgi:Tfp pilus assembly protein PilX